MLVLDDPLSAVDAAVGSQIFEQGIRRFVRIGGTALMAMNQLQLARNCDQVVFLSAGRIATQGTFDEVMSSGDKEFSSLIQKFGNVVSVDDLGVAALAKQTPAEQSFLEGDAEQNDRAGEPADNSVILSGGGAQAADTDGAAKACDRPLHAAKESVSVPPTERRGSVYFKFFEAMGWPSVIIYLSMLLLTYSLLGVSTYSLVGRTFVKGVGL